MPETITYLPLTFIPLFFAMDPFGMLPVFTSLTSGMSVEKKKGVIKFSILTALIISVLFAFVGEAVFRILGITVDDFKIAGGLLLLVLAILELTGRGAERRPLNDVGVVPLGVPMLVGPAVLTVMIVLIDNYGVAPTIISLVINLTIVFAVFSAEKGIMKLIGKNGLIAISKIVMLLLAAIAVMLIRNGMESYFNI